MQQQRISSPGLQIAICDPSLFTIPYDGLLCDGLAAQGCAVTWLGRALRRGEAPVGGTAIKPFFYGRTGARESPRSLAARLRKGGQHVRDMLELVLLARLGAYDLVHFQWSPLPLLDRWLIGRLRQAVPTVLTVHDTMPFNGRPSSWMQTLCSRDVLDAFDHLIVHTTDAEARLHSYGVPSDRISIVPHGLLSAAAPEPARRPASQAAGSGKLKILLFGKLKHYKGADVLIEAFGQVAPELRDRAELWIVGQPFLDVAPLQARAAALGIAGAIRWDLRYLGDREVEEIVGAADILAFPYRAIDASGVLMTALPMGKPMVASRIGLFAELLEDGRHGRLVAPDDPAALARALADLLRDPAGVQAMGAAVRRLAADVPSWPEIGRRTVQVYQQVRARWRAEIGAARARATVPHDAVVPRRPGDAVEAAGPYDRDRLRAGTAARPPLGAAVVGAEELERSGRPGRP